MGLSTESGFAVQQRLDDVAVVAGDDVQMDAFAAHCGALADLGAAAETFGVVLVDHRHGARVPRGLSLRQKSEESDLRAEEERGRTVGARRDAGAAADAGRRVERSV